MCMLEPWQRQQVCVPASTAAAVQWRVGCIAVPVAGDRSVHACACEGLRAGLCAVGLRGLGVFVCML